MNYLAHAYLSFELPDITAGNMISDFVKGKKKLEFSPGIQLGISLHRFIDAFTDGHPATREAKTFFKPAYGLYAGAFMDVVYDHFLANDPLVFPGDALALFSQKTYAMLEPYEPLFPERFGRMFYYMRTQDWLYHYRTREGIKNSFGGLVRRALYLKEHESAFRILEENYEALQVLYTSFFPEVKESTFRKLQEWNVA